MANAKKCDRCGTFYVKNIQYTKQLNLCNTTIDGVGFTTSSGSITDCIDLCDDCITKIKLFLDGKDLEEG